MMPFIGTCSHNQMASSLMVTNHTSVPCGISSSRGSGRNQLIRYRRSNALITSTHRHASKRLVKVQAEDQPVARGEIVDVEDLKGVRILIDDDGNAKAEYLVQWKDGHPDTWEPQTNLADNLLRDFEERWWTCARTGDEETLRKLLEGGGKALARAVDENGRSALHFHAALGRVAGCTMLCQAGADVNVQDKDGYSPLHMAAGYLHTASMKVLLQYGADPEMKDRQGRSVLELAENLRGSIPVNPTMISRRMALENVAKMLTETLFEDVDPGEILDVREAQDGSMEYLVRWMDDAPDSWVGEKFMSEEVIAEYKNGIEYREAQQLLDMKQRGDERFFLVRWCDEYPDSWEPEENVAPDLIQQMMEQRQHHKRQAAESSSTLHESLSTPHDSIPGIRHHAGVAATHVNGGSVLDVNAGTRGPQAARV